MPVTGNRTIEVAFGRGTLPISLPAAAEPTVIRKSALPKLPDASAAIRQAFERRSAAMPLRDLARGRKSACILICDITRPVPNRLIPASDDRNSDTEAAFRSTGSPCW